MNLTLVSKTPMVMKIFTLVSNKLNINLIIKDNIEIEDENDFIIVDEEFINDEFNNLRKYTKKLAAITSDELPFNKTRDFIVNRPFLPTTLEEMLSEQIEFIKEDEKTIAKEVPDDLSSFDIESEEQIITDYVDSLVDDVAYNIEEENDESIVTLASLNDGGILDNLELNKISDILHDDDIQNEVSVDENDWKDITDIIDEALSEVKDYEFDLEAESRAPIRLLLNNYNIDELKPFLQKFDQSVIDRLSNGEDVDVTLSLKVNK